MTKALSLFKSNSDRKYIVFFTDGEDNRTGEGDLTYDEVITQSKEKGIRIISVGLGRDLNQDTLNKLANETNGRYFNANVLDKLQEYTRKVYEEIQ